MGCSQGSILQFSQCFGAWSWFPVLHLLVFVSLFCIYVLFSWTESLGFGFLASVSWHCDYCVLVIVT